MREDSQIARRPVPARGAAWAVKTAAVLARARVRPNTISLAGVAFAAVGCAALVLSPRAGTAVRVGLYLTATLMVVARALCNLLDGMVAVEHGHKTASGLIFNDLPDRVSDVLMLAGAGYAIPSVPGGLDLGWLAAVVAVTTAYARMLGGAAGVQQPFLGPMAKQQRMALMGTAWVVAAAVTGLGYHEGVVAAALGVVAVGGVLTVARRTLAIARELGSR